jgi:hypothetical protein
MTDPSHPTGTGPTISESTIPNILPRPERRGFPPGPYWDGPPSEVMIIHESRPRSFMREVMVIRRSTIHG